MSWDSFTTVETTDDVYSLTWSGQGMAGAGKSHFLLTAPDPVWVAVFSDPGGISRLVKQNPEFKKKDIRWVEYSFNPGAHSLEDRPKVAQEALQKFEADYYTALKHARTVGWDKEDQVWELLRYAKLEYYTDKPASYYELNLEMANWIHDAGAAGVNLGILRGMKEKWGANAKGTPTGTGVYEPRGWKELDEKVIVNLEHYFDMEERAFKARIGNKCRSGPATELIGKEFTELTFEELVLELYPETAGDMSVWGL